MVPNTRYCHNIGNRGPWPKDGSRYGTVGAHCSSGRARHNVKKRNRHRFHVVDEHIESSTTEVKIPSRRSSFLRQSDKWMEGTGATRTRTPVSCQLRVRLDTASWNLRKRKNTEAKREDRCSVRKVSYLTAARRNGITPGQHATRLTTHGTPAHAPRSGETAHKSQRI